VTGPLKLILTHDNADFDAVASMLAAHKLDIEARPVLPHRINRNVEHFINLYGAALPFIRREELKRGATVDHVTVVDTQAFSTARGMRPNTPILFIDHHPLTRPLAENQHYMGEPVGAATTLLVEQIRGRGISIEPLEATLLMLGIYEDTGSLTYGTTTSRDILCAAWLMECGAKLDVVREFIQHPLTPEQRALYEQLIEHTEMRTINGHVIALATAHIDQPVDEIATVAHKLRELYEPGAVFVLVQLNGDMQLVARGTVNAIDVSIIAKRFGGGGHGRAAAALIRSRRVADVRDEILAVLPDVVTPSIRVEALMSLGAQTVRAVEQIRSAADRMKKSGHEGYPVVDHDQIVGLLNRREVDRAMSHGMGHQLVQEIMDAGQVTVKPGDSIEILQQRMMRSGWGQIPVVDDNGHLIGIVTRTDLIKQWGQHPDDTRRGDMARRMQAAMSPSMWALIMAVARHAQQRRIGVYVVGGYVRDLLLGISNHHDIDLVVEGDAIELVRTLRDTYGGDMRSHAQFGTAKWLLDATVAQALGVDLADAHWPPAIDLVSARTEFYEEPTALPTVQRGSIKLDLYRRDFTINTLAVRLSPEPLGDLLDFYGGEQDLNNGVIRVIHSLSFVDDPTRMLRAVRLEQRLGFKIEPRTRELIRGALPLLDRVSGDRIRHELRLILAEEQPLRALVRLEQFGILAALHPALRIDEWARAVFYAIRYARQHYPWPSLNTFDNWMLTTFALLTSRLPQAELERLGRRLQFSREYLDHLHDARAAISFLPDLSHEQLPSVIVRLLEALGEVGWLAAWAAAPTALAREQIVRFVQEWRWVKPTVNGRDIQIFTGLKPGPLFGVILGRLRQAWLDGEITTPEEEKALLLQVVSARVDAANPTSGDKSC
jgi:tRNA nucleotidyltransferase (CCA-adding enzyme)